MTYSLSMHIRRRIAGTLIALTTSAVAETSDLEIRYRVRFSGVPDGQILREMKSVSDTIALRRSPPISERQLQRRAERDLPRFQQILRGHGYHAADVTLRVNTQRRPARVTYQVTAGEAYRLRAVHMEPAVDSAVGVMPRLPELGLYREAPFSARAAMRASGAMAQQLQHQGYPFARVTDPEVYVEHAAQAVDLRYEYVSGPPASFGALTFSGLVTVRESFLRAKAPWQEDDPYDGSLLRQAQRRWSGSGLFASVRILKGETLDEAAAVPVHVAVSERKHRTLSLGGGYATDEGMRARATWEHRNLFARGERLTLSSAASEISYSTEARFQKPDFRRVDQTLTASVRAALDEPDAFRSRNVGAAVGIDRLIRSGLVAGGGLGFKYASVRDTGDQERFGLLYVPLRLDHDTSDDLLDPRRGGRWSLGVTPYQDVIGRDVMFHKLRASGTRYLQLGRRPEIDLAGRLTLASILGEERVGIPADERLYAGGGGTIRGYAFQSVGPLDGKAPLGGRSLAVTSAELRWRLNPEFGLVAFLDGGTAFEGTHFDSGEKLLWGTGIGFRYFTPVGPLRFDLAFPLDRRRGTDEAYQFYISLGQAF
jgi:translocation and assembly module TamA